MSSSSVQNDLSIAMGHIDISRPPSESTSEYIKRLLERQESLKQSVFKPFPDIHSQRLDQLSKMICSFRIFAQRGYDEGVAGHLSYRDPEYHDHIWLNPFGINFKKIEITDLILINSEGEVVCGIHGVNKAAWAIHFPILKQNPKLNSACHLHSMYGKTFSALHTELKPINQDACAFYMNHALFDVYNGVVWDDEEGIAMGEIIKKKKVDCLILRNHGLITAGETVDEASWRFVNMERACQSQIILLSTCQKYTLIDHDTALIVRYQTGTPFMAWFNYQSLLQGILVDHPKLMPMHIDPPVIKKD